MIVTVMLNPSVDKLYIVDKLKKGRVMRMRQVKNTAGGKGMNVSRALAIAGEQVCATGFVGGINGRLFETLIEQPCIKKCFTYVEAETRCCVNVWDENENTSTEFLEPGDMIYQKEIDCFQMDFERAVKECDCVCISGSLPKGVDARLYVWMIEHCKERQIPVVVDTSGDALVKSVEARPTMIKPNMDEISCMVGKRITTQEECVSAAQLLQKQGIGYVLVSMGEKGVIAVCDAGTFYARPPKVDIVNTVGCGDSMIAGFAWSMVRGYKMEDMLRRAVAVATASAMERGTASFKVEKMHRILSQVIVQKL